MVAENSGNVLDRKICLECHRQFTGIISACPHDGTLLISVLQDPLIGTTLAGNYEILSVIGQGGMGVVYKARHTLMDRIVAIKMLQAQLISDSMSVKRFQQESKAASRINHPHVIAVYDFGISPSGQPYIVMDFLEGKSLSEVIKEDGNVGVERTIKILSQACDALDHAHHQGVIHRDLKPSNIVLINYDEEKDFVKVVDFGVAKLIGQDIQRLTQVGEVCGSPVYMSPEQCKGLELDPCSDIYSMGIVLYETLTGRLPFLGKTMVETMAKHINEPPPRFGDCRPDLYIPERLEAVTLKALSKEPLERHKSMGELQQDLELAIPRPGRSQVLRTAPLQWTTGKSIDFKVLLKQYWIQLSLAAVLLTMCGIASFVLWHATHPTAALPKPQTGLTIPPADKSVGPSSLQNAALTTPNNIKSQPESEQQSKRTAASTIINHAAIRHKPSHQRQGAVGSNTTKLVNSEKKHITTISTPKPSKNTDNPKDPWAELRKMRSY